VADQRVVFDTNVLWHGLLPSDDPIAPVCKRLLYAVDEGEIQAYSSTLSLVELPKVIVPRLPIERLVALTELLRDSAIVWVPLTEAIAMRARELSLE
jgi:predicted nucleic acid-binding protein